MNETWALPQPWDLMQMSKEQYLAWVDGQEAVGRRLVIDTYYDAYPDGGDADELWLFSTRVITDYRSGKVLHVLDFEDEQPSGDGFENLLTVERVLAET